MNPLFSIIMAVYNTQDYVGNAIESILNQSLGDFELIVIDDGSTDCSPAIIDRYAEKDRRIVAVHQENSWIFPTYNRGVQMARGQYITFLNSDDYLEPDALAIMAGYIEKYHVDVVFENVASHICDKQQKIIKKNHQNSVMMEEFVILGQENVRKSWIDIIKCGLVRNCVNAYRANLLKAHPFREDIYGADFMINIDLASEITSAACHPKDLYLQYIYHATDKMNASMGKYYPYEHDMFNEFNTKYIALFESWGLYTDTANELLCHMRVNQLQTEYESFFAVNCPFPQSQRALQILSLIDDTVFYCCMRAGRMEEEEQKILRLCAQFNRSGAGVKKSVVGRALEAAFRANVKNGGLQALRTFVTMKANPSHIGLPAYEGLSQRLSAKDDIRYAAYVRAKQAVKYAYLDDNVISLQEKIPKIEAAPYNDPERMALLCGAYVLLGDMEKAYAYAEKGAELFPEDPDLKYNLECLSAG